MYVQCPRELEEDAISCRIGVTDVSEPPHGYSESAQIALKC